MKIHLSPAMRSLAASAATVLFSATAAIAAVDDPSISGWSGTAYHPGGWFTYNMAKPDTAMKFSSGFLLSPLYSAPIRKVAVVATRSKGGDKALSFAPFANGVEGVAQVRALESSGSAQIIDFDPAENVTAFRMYVGSSGSGYWTVSRICVFYGEKTADEDDRYSALTGMLAKPDNLRAESFAADSLTVAVDPVGGASGYCFKVERVDSVPETVVREDFVNAPYLSEGWTFGDSLNAGHDRYTGASSSSFPDVKTGIDNADDNASALKIEKGNSSGEVKVEIVSPLLPSAVREVSFVSKMAGGTSSTSPSDAISVYGRTSESADWLAIGEAFKVSTSKTWTTNAVDVACGYRQIKFEFAAESADTCRNCGLDTLRVVYGGNETRATVADGSVTNELPRLELSGLDTARYGFSAKAVGDDYGDSPWADEKIVDLAWAGVVATAPENVAVEASGGSLHVSWVASAGAAFYRVVAVSTEDSDVVVSQETTGTTCDLAVPAAGEYEVTVTAFSPGGMTSASAAAQSATVELGAVGAVSAAATDDGEITATWAAVPLAAGYSARIFMLSDGDSTRTPVGNAYVSVPVAVFSGLDTSARYVVEVVPQPGEDASLGATSEVVDMSLVRFRKKGAAPLGVDGWSEGFDALSVMTTAADFKTVPLDYWQIAKGAAAQVKLNYTSGTSSTAGGVYALSDTGRTALGSLATRDTGVTFGIALVNASELAVERDMTLSFDMIQWCYRDNPAAYALEWKVTDGETSILSEGGWTAVEIPSSAPYVATNCPESKYVQNASVNLSLPARLAPGGVLILRWKHPKTSSGPIMAIDNVRLASQRHQTALRITIR